MGALKALKSADPDTNKKTSAHVHTPGKPFGVQCVSGVAIKIDKQGSSTK